MPDASPSPEKLKSLTKEFFHRAYTLADASVIDERVAPKVINYGLGPEPQTTREQFKAWYTPFVSSFSNIACSVSHCIVEGNWVSARIVFSAIHTGPGLGVPASHNKVSLTALVLVRFENNQIVEGYNEFNQLALMQQITPAAH